MGVGGVDGIEGREVVAVELLEEDVWIDRLGRTVARSRFEDGGLRDGDAFKLSDSPVGVARAGGRNDGSDPPTFDISAAKTLCEHHRCDSDRLKEAGRFHGSLSLGVIE